MRKSAKGALTLWQEGKHPALAVSRRPDREGTVAMTAPISLNLWKVLRTIKRQLDIRRMNDLQVVALRSLLAKFKVPQTEWHAVWEKLQADFGGKGPHEKSMTTLTTLKLRKTYDQLATELETGMGNLQVVALRSLLPKFNVPRTEWSKVWEELLKDFGGLDWNEVID